MVNDARTAGQRGEGRFGGLVSMALFAAFCYAAWNVAPVYLADYNLGDKMVEICRLTRAQNTDERIAELLMKEVREQDLSDFIPKGSFKIETREGARRISVEYERSVKVLPGWVRTFRFSHKVDEPFF